MKCTCPKCQGKIELGLEAVSEEGTTTSCPACNATITVFSESFGGRALRKTGEITCSVCGTELGPQVHCENCGTAFPQYLVTCQGRKKGPKKAKVKLKSSPFKRSSKPAPAFTTLDQAMSGVPGRGGKPAPGKGLPKGVTIAIAVAVLVAAAVGGFMFYSQRKVEAAYMKNYARTVYGIQVGINMSRTVCQKIATEWKSSNDAGKAYFPRAGADDLKQLQAINKKVTSIKAKCAQEPEKFKSCNDRFAGLERVYKKMQTLALTPGNSLAGFTDAVNRNEAEYTRAAMEFKNSVPEELMDELRTSSRIYSDLRPLLK